MQATLTTMHDPYENEAINKVYNLLFCDDIGLYRSETKTTAYPWGILFSDDPSVEQLNGIINDDTLESRHKLLAYNLLSANGTPVKEKELLAVIIEVGLPEGLDVLAAFKDGTARYINYTERLIVWEAQTEQSTTLVNNLFAAGENVVSKIGPWDQARKSQPGDGKVRLNFLVSDGLYFGEGPLDFLQKDAMGGPVIDSAICLMNFLIDQSLSKQKPAEN